MRIVLSLFVVAGLASAVFCNVPSDKSSSTPNVPPGEFVVHEWGTFTSISGSDGVRLEFRPLLDNDLPDFVINRAWQAGRVPNPLGKWSFRSFQRMETPVTYFYTDRERDVSVKVGFPKGLLTEFYPPVASMKPDFDWNKRAAIENSELDWGRVTLIPTSHLRPQVSTPGLADRIHEHTLSTIVPGSDTHPHYAFARETDSALVHVRRAANKDRAYTPSGDFFEKFLFYRGLGNFPLPLQITAQTSGRFELSNTGPEPIRSLFLVTVHGDEVRFRQYDAIAAEGHLALEQSTSSASIDELSEAVVKALVAENLFEKEARAMVKTWRDSWFQEEGTRLFYMLPERLTDELLPLTIQPRPDKVVRVMVGRLEIMTPENETRVTQLVQQSATLRQKTAEREAARRAAQENGEVVEVDEDAATTSKPPEALAQLGRLAEPALVRVKYFATDATVRNEAGLLLNELHQHWSAAGK